jgi:hypothetical protein
MSCCPIHKIIRATQTFGDVPCSAGMGIASPAGQKIWEARFGKQRDFLKATEPQT